MYDYEETIEKISNLDCHLFCHFSDVDAKFLVNSDLGLEEKDWFTTLLELTEEEKYNLAQFMEDQIRFNFKSATIVAIPSDQNNDFVERNYNNDKTIANMPYIVPNRYILASVNVLEKELYLNELSDVLIYGEGR